MGTLRLTDIKIISNFFPKRPYACFIVIVQVLIEKHAPRCDLGCDQNKIYKNPTQFELRECSLSKIHFTQETKFDASANRIRAVRL